MGKTYKIRKPKKRINSIAESLAKGTIQLGRAGRHEDKRKKEKYKGRWDE